MAEEDLQRAVVKPSLAKDMRKVFDGIGRLCSVLDVSRPTWQRIYSEKSVKVGTATKLVQEFFALLTDIANGAPVPEGVYPQFGLVLFRKYQADIAALQFDAYVEEYVPPRPKEVQVATIK